MSLEQLKSLFATAGCVRLYAKPLAENDNSKNQVYFGPDFQALNLFPTDGIIAADNSRNPIFKARIRFGWLQPGGGVAEAPGAQFILYPQYPEVRFSGFLKGCRDAPSALMAGRLGGRVLFLGVTADRRVVGFVTGAENPVSEEFRVRSNLPTVGVFHQLDLPRNPTIEDGRSKLLAELARIHRLGWVDSKQLAEDGSLRPCRAPQCGGFTLEAELGIPKNSRAEPDYLGWEVKQHAVSNFLRPHTGTAITLMTPEPTVGIYRDAGVEAFVRKFGYPDKNGRPDRLNFGGIHRVGERQSSTGLTMTLSGYDSERSRITDANGAIMLVSDDGELAASWPFSGLLAHWSHKHSKAVYVPSLSRKQPRWQYCYGHRVRLAQKTDPLRLLAALAKGVVYYDPGIKLEHASGDAKVKRRSQFRVASKGIDALYETVEVVEV